MCDMPTSHLFHCYSCSWLSKSLGLPSGLQLRESKTTCSTILKVADQVVFDFDILCWTAVCPVKFTYFLPTDSLYPSVSVVVPKVKSSIRCDVLQLQVKSKEYWTQYINSLSMNHSLDGLAVKWRQAWVKITDKGLYNGGGGGGEFHIIWT